MPSLLEAHTTGPNTTITVDTRQLAQEPGCNSALFSARSSTQPHRACNAWRRIGFENGHSHKLSSMRARKESRSC